MLVVPAMLLRLFSRRTASLLFKSYKVLGDVDKASGMGNSFTDRLKTKRERDRYARILAEKFVKMTRHALNGNVYGFPEKSPFTKRIQGSNGLPPLKNTGELITHLKIEKRLFGYSVGWDQRVLRGSRGEASVGSRRRRLKAYQLVRLLENGARIRANHNTPTGRNVRRFFKAHGAYLKNSTKFIVIPPRPFYTRTIAQFIKTYSGVGGAKIRKVGYRLYITVDKPSGAGSITRGTRR